jgi:TPR repeat protein
MGFKRTSEGRVFFQGNDDAASESLTGRGGEHTQLQILTLLKALNERLKITQAERNKMRQQLETYRFLIEDLAGKAEQSQQTVQSTESRAAQAEKLAAEMLQELQETRKLLFEIEDKAQRADKGVTSLKILQKDQAEKMATTVAGYAQLKKQIQESETRQEDFGRRLEETAGQQSRLVRKIDQAIEDRARFMRKIERIEETVIQTRDSLNAKAMVLLTDQGVGAQGQESGSMQGGRTAIADLKDLPFWKRPLQLQTTAVASLLVAGVLVGWLTNEVQKPQLPDLSGVNVPSLSVLGGSNSEDAAPVSGGTPETKWNVQDDTSAFSAAEAPLEKAPVQDRRLDALDDIGTLDVADDKQLLELLGDNPDALAAKLNEIEPGLADEMPESSSPAAVEDPYEQASLGSPTSGVATAPTPLQATPKPEAKAFKAPPETPEEFLKSDPSLPEALQQVEAKAFEGSPEAQHDLAAIYTAGHAGAKQDYRRAVYWFRQAADQGVANASYNLGVLYHQGLGVQFDIEEAIKWYEKAAQKDHPEAQYNLGIAYIEGIGVPYDPASAADYFESAAQSGVTEAAYNLGLIYENGLLGTAKPDQALAWYKTAADKGSPEAKAALEQLAKSLGVSLDEVNRLTEGMASQKKPKALPQKETSVPRAAPMPEVKAADTIEFPEIPGPQAQEQLLIAQVQEYLMHVGLYPGPADGVAGPLTADAIKSYQSMYKLPVSGQPSRELLAHMIETVSAEGMDSNDFGSRE